MPSDWRRPSKNAASPISAGLVMLEAVVGDKARDEIGGLAAGMAGPVRHHPAEIDIEHDAAEIEQQRVGGGGSWRQIHGNRLQNWTGVGNGRRRFASSPSGA